MPKPSWGGAGAGALSGAAAGSAFGPIGTGIGAVVGGLGGLFSGGSKTPKIRPQSLLRGEQEPLYNQLVNAGMAPGAGGAFGGAADYYRNNLSDNPADFGAFAAPQIRQFNEDFLPSLSEQFAGMGSGGLSSSGFRNAAVNATTDLAERLAQIRANLRQASAQGLQSIGQAGLGRFSENVYPERQPGFAEGITQGFGQAIPSLLTKIPNQVGANTDPYRGGNVSASPQLRQFGEQGNQSLLPGFSWR